MDRGYRPRRRTTPVVPDVRSAARPFAVHRVANHSVEPVWFSITETPVLFLAKAVRDFSEEARADMQGRLDTHDRGIRRTTAVALVEAERRPRRHGVLSVAWFEWNGVRTSFWRLSMNRNQNPTIDHGSENGTGTRRGQPTSIQDPPVTGTESSALVGVDGGTADAEARIYRTFFVGDGETHRRRTPATQTSQ